jgi:hypothetical protein
VDRELTALVASLERQRGHILSVAEGLTPEQQHRPMLPSGWSCLGLVRHLAVDVEQFWFSAVVAGEPFDESEFGDDPVAAWRVDAATDPARVLARYRQEIAGANAIIAARDGDVEPAAWPVERWPDWRMADLRTVILHVITETACHTGHLDAGVELLDGRQWFRITN